MARQSKGTPRSKAWWDGYEGHDRNRFDDERETEAVRYHAMYDQGAEARQAAHERLNAVCAAGRRTDELLKREYGTRGPARAEFMGEVRDLVGVNGMG